MGTGAGGLYRERAARGAPARESDVTAEGVFANYFFETGDEKTSVFTTRLALGICPNPTTRALEHYVAVGLNSKFDGEGIVVHGRPPVSVVLCLDISGSMNVELAPGEPNKIDVAKKSLLSLFDRLCSDDSIALVTFNVKAETVIALAPKSAIDRAAFAAAVNGLEADRGTDLSAGFRMATSLLDGEPATRERRIMFLTDMQPNAGEFSGDGLFALAEVAAGKGIGSTFFGVGLDFDMALVDRVTNGIRGASYESIKSAPSFEKRMARDFDFAVFPIAYSVSVSVESAGFDILEAYGSQAATKAKTEGQRSLELLKIGTLFPSAKEEGGMTRGGMFLLKLAPIPVPAGAVSQTEGERRRIDVIRRFIDREGAKHEERETVVIPENTQIPYYENPSVRKAILLSRFVEAVRGFIRTKDRPALEAFATHFQAESAAIGDTVLVKDLNVLRDILEPTAK